VACLWLYQKQFNARKTAKNGFKINLSKTAQKLTSKHINNNRYLSKTANFGQFFS